MGGKSEKVYLLNALKPYVAWNAKLKIKVQNLEHTENKITRVTIKLWLSSQQCDKLRLDISLNKWTCFDKIFILQLRPI